VTGPNTVVDDLSALDATWLVNIRKLYGEQVAESKRKYVRGEQDEETTNLILSGWVDIFSKVIANRFNVTYLTGYEMLVDKDGDAV